MGSEELILVRHAHAERDAASNRDIDRPLSTLGFSQAEAAAAWLTERQLRPAKVLCSPALRARQTLAALQTRLPGLLVFDHDDPEIPPQQFREAAVGWPDCRVLETRGLGHNRILRDRGVIDAVVGYLRG